MSNGMRGSRSRIARVREAISDPASTNSRPNKIGIVGYYGCGNLGDDTVVAILIKRIKESYPGAEIVGFSLNPADTERRHGIKAFHIRGKDEARFPGRPAAPSTSDVKPFVSSRLKEVLRKWPALFNPVSRAKESARPPFERDCSGIVLLVEVFSLTAGFRPSDRPGIGSPYRVVGRSLGTPLFAAELGPARQDDRDQSHRREYRLCKPENAAREEFL